MIRQLFFAITLIGAGGFLNSFAQASSPMDARAQATTPKSSVFYTPPKREKPALTADEVSKLKSDLSAARDKRTTVVKSRDVKRAKP
jgi:hypothetical protein